MTTDPREALLAVERELKALADKRRYDMASSYVPFAKQTEFHDNGLVSPERCFSAGNQIGKTYSGAAEASYHLTGLYPEWWMGRRWDRPTRAWAAGVTGESTRDNPQRLLLGTTADMMAYGVGTGMIPKKCLSREKMTLARGVSDLYDTVLVKHFNPEGRPDGFSELKFKSYERGREKWQGDTLDFIWFDEEPPEDIYEEGQARLTATDGMSYLTFTPLNGVTSVVKKFFDEVSPARKLTIMTVEDSPLFTPERIVALKQKYPKHQWQCRLYGQPLQGEGAVFTFLRDDIACDPFKAPLYWSYIWGLDFGVQHPFAAVLLAWDKDNDVIYVMHTVRMSDALPLNHVAAMKAVLEGTGNKVPAAWPQDGHQRREFDGQLVPMAKIYKTHGQRMLDHHATFPDGSNSTEAGIMEMQERFQLKKLKVFSPLGDWFQEYGRYHRKDGQLVKIDDDLMSATRVGIMAKRYARPILFREAQDKPAVKIAEGAYLDDPWQA